MFLLQPDRLGSLSSGTRLGLQVTNARWQEFDHGRYYGEILVMADLPIAAFPERRSPAPFTGRLAGKFC